MLEIIVCYTVGTLIGCLIGYKTGIVKGIDITLDSLVRNKFLRTRKTIQGEIEILKWNQTDSAS